MITKIQIKNSSGISEQVTLDLTRGKYDYRNQFIYQDRVINPAVIYGRNGSGKTSVLKSISNIIQIFSGDLLSGEYYAMPHAFGSDKTTEIILDFRLNEIEYTYEVHILDRDTIAYELLSSDNAHCIVKRDQTGITVANPNDSRKKDRLQEFLIDGTVNSKLSAVRYIGMNDINSEVSSIYSYFKTFKFVATNKSISEIGAAQSVGDLLVKYNDKYTNIITGYNHIMNLKFRVDKLATGERITALYRIDEKEYELDFETQISAGTKDLYRMLATLLALEPGSLIVIDELEKTMHPELLDKLIVDIVSKLDVQIICSSHNVHLLQSLRPDQIYFTKKENNMTTLTRLSVESPGIREIHNIEKLYLGGRIG